MRRCGCGCRASIEHLAGQARYLNDAHRKRAERTQKPGQSDDLGHGSTEPGLGRLERPPPAQMTPKEMRARLDALAEKFDRRGSTSAMRKEARTLARALVAEAKVASDRRLGIVVRLRPQVERDAALRDHVETTHLYDEQTGEWYEPDPPPEVPGWGQDDDEPRDHDRRFQ
jgi:hypothetical protein